MKIHTTREATPEEAADILADMERRANSGKSVRAALAKHCMPERLAELFAGLPADSQRRVALKCLAEPPVRRSVKITIRHKLNP
jgi:hypothetical protein